jgi:excisionase family DNA binding protein
MKMIPLESDSAPKDPASLESLRLLPVATVADLLGCSRNFVYQAVYSGRLEGVHTGRSLKIRASALRSYIEANSTG